MSLRGRATSHLLTAPDVHAREREALSSEAMWLSGVWVGFCLHCQSKCWDSRVKVSKVVLNRRWTCGVTPTYPSIYTHTHTQMQMHMHVRAQAHTHTHTRTCEQRFTQPTLRSEAGSKMEGAFVPSKTAYATVGRVHTDSAPKQPRLLALVPALTLPPASQTALKNIGGTARACLLSYSWAPA